MNRSYETVTEQERAAILRMHADALPIKAIAESVGLTWALTWRIVNEAGKPQPDRSVLQRVRSTPNCAAIVHRNQEIVARYMDGKTGAEIAAAVGVHSSTVFRVLRANHVLMRRKKDHVLVRDGSRAGARLSDDVFLQEFTDRLPEMSTPCLHNVSRLVSTILASRMPRK